MKVVERIEIEFVVPESAEEKAEIERILREVKEEELSGTFNPSKLKRIEPSISDPEGYWKKKQSN